MAEPAMSSGAVASAAAFTSVFLAWVGVEPQAIGWSLVGAASLHWFGVSESPKGIKASGAIFLSALLGAAFGTAFMSLFAMKERALLVTLWIVCGAAAQPLLAEGIDFVVKKFRRAT